MQKGKITISNANYNYLLFDVITLVNLLKTKKILMQSLQNSISDLRNNKDFSIYTLFNENVAVHPKETLYFIIYKNDEVVATSRIVFKKNSNRAYINMVYTNPKYRGKKICQNNLKKLIGLTNFKIYHLDVDRDNYAAIKCYENVGFKYIWSEKYNDLTINIMKLVRNL